MDQPIIEIKGIGKKYNIFHSRVGYLTFRDLVTEFFKNPIKAIKSKISNEDFWALKDVNLDIYEGEVIGIIGQNGSGKSTLLKILSQITPPTEGEIKIRGKVASLLEVGTGFHPELTGRENIYLNGAILGMSKEKIKENFSSIIEFAGIEKFMDTPVKRYSSGMYVRLAFSVAAHLEPDILIVDEVLAVGDVEFQKKCLGKMDEVATKSGRTVLFVSHNMDAIKQLCEKTILLKEGRVELFGETRKVVEKYLEKTIQKVAQSDTGLRKINKDYYLEKVEIKNKNSEPCDTFEVGDTMQVHIFANKPAPVDNFTVEFMLYNEKGTKISFGAANPVQNTFYKKGQTEFVCELGPLPLTSGKYWFDFSVRVWGQERWDMWKQAVFFEISRCDLYNTGYNVTNDVNGGIIINQIWR